MRDEAKVHAFELCIQQVLEGVDPAETLKRFPQWAEEFRPLLDAASAGQALGRRIQVPKAAQSRNRMRFLAEARALSKEPARRPAWGFFRLAPVALLLVLVIFFTGASTIVGATQSLPGDALYSLKLLTEKTRLRLVRDPQTRLELEQSFDRQRLEEVDELINRSRTAPVTFAGELEQTQSGDWYVGDVHVVVGSDTQISSDVKPGIFVGVEGQLLEDGSVKAARIWGREFKLSGTVQGITGELWIVGGVPISIPANVALPSLVPVGSQVIVRVMQKADGSLVARSVELVAFPPALDNTTNTQSVPASATRTQTADASQPERTSETGISTEEQRTPERSETEDDRETEQTDKTRRPSETPKPNDDGDKTPEPSETPKPDDDDDKTPEITATPKPRDTDRPGETPHPTRTERPSETPKPEKTDEPTRPPEYSRTPEPTDD